MPRSNWAPDIRPLVIGHRGASGLAPENTLAAFRLAAALGADGVEFDVQLSSDGCPVVIHDSRVNRTTDTTGAVASMTADRLAELDAGSWYDRRLAMRPLARRRLLAMINGSDGIIAGPASTRRSQSATIFAGEPLPKLESVLKTLATLSFSRVYIEIKGNQKSRHELLGATLAQVKESSTASIVTILSFDGEIVRRCKELAPELRTAINLPASRAALPGLKPILRAAQAAAADEVSLHFALATERVVHGLHDRGIRVAAWTVNRKMVMRRLIHSGVGSIITNYPERLYGVIAAAARSASESAGGSSDTGLMS